jgi:hypothetical protein
MNRNLEVHNTIERIFSSQAAAIDRLAEGFHYLLVVHLENSDRETELLKALGDRDQLVKEQIKRSTIQHVLEVFDDCYFRATGESWPPKQDVDDE